MLGKALRCLLHVGLVLSASALSGCNKASTEQLQGKAEAALETALNAWVRGEAADKYSDVSQPIQITDPDWKSGSRLLSFLTVESKPSTESADHFRCRVALSLQDRKGKKVEKEVDYEVRLGDKIVIERAVR
jgi:hypothetical protein